MRPGIIILLLAVWNVLVFIVYGADKKKAKRGAYRISERTLLGLAFIMGGVGAFLGMYLLRHKTKHIKFKLGVPLALLCNAGMIWIAVLLLMN